ncbi:MAG: isochorismatase family protein [Candidatus Xenobia bacterium]
MLKPEETALVVIDMQEAFRSAIADFAEVAVRIGKAVQAAHELGVYVIGTEQYPRGLQHTAPEISLPLPPLEKMSFSSCGEPAFVEALHQHGVKAVLVCGIEAHICVTQTTLDLLAGGFQVHLLWDCISSRHPDSKQIAWQRLTRAGATPSTLEMALFELLQTARSPHFKAIQSLIR